MAGLLGARLPQRGKHLSLPHPWMFRSIAQCCRRSLLGPLEPGAQPFESLRSRLAPVPRGISLESGCSDPSIVEKSKTAGNMRVEDNLRLLIGEIKPGRGFGLQRQSNASIVLDEQSSIVKRQGYAHRMIDIVGPIMSGIAAQYLIRHARLIAIRRQNGINIHSQAHQFRVQREGSRRCLISLLDKVGEHNDRSPGCGDVIQTRDEPLDGPRVAEVELSTLATNRQPIAITAQIRGGHRGQRCRRQHLPIVKSFGPADQIIG